MTAAPFLALCVGAFFLGAVPFGFIAGRMRGVDLREHGSKNIGATNTLRVLGPRAGVMVLLLDAAKGLLPVLVARRMGADAADPGAAAWWVVAVGMAAVLGHTYSPYVRFKGGKGVATSLGVLIALNPLVAGISFAVFFLTVWLTRYVSLGSMLGAVTQAALFWALPGQPLAYRLFATLVGVFVVVRHRANVRRLMNGTESRFGEKAKDIADTAETPPESGREDGKSTG
jgi:glycerol-3-phosphate acyltransferase PlsY